MTVRLSQCTQAAQTSSSRQQSKTQLEAGIQRVLTAFISCVAVGLQFSRGIFCASACRPRPAEVLRWLPLWRPLAGGCSDVPRPFAGAAVLAGSSSISKRLILPRMRPLPIEAPSSDAARGVHLNSIFQVPQALSLYKLTRPRGSLARTVRILIHWPRLYIRYLMLRRCSILLVIRCTVLILMNEWDPLAIYLFRRALSGISAATYGRRHRSLLLSRPADS